MLLSYYNRGECMDYMTELTAIAKTHGGIIETKIAAQRGISKAMLYKLCKEDKIHRIVKGQYILPDDMQDELLAISNRSERIIFLTKQLFTFTEFLTVLHLSIRLLHRLVVFLLRQLNLNAKCIISSLNCLNLAKQR